MPSAFTLSLLSVRTACWHWFIPVHVPWLFSLKAAASVFLPLLSGSLYLPCLLLVIHSKIWWHPLLQKPATLQCSGIEWPQRSGDACCDTIRSISLQGTRRKMVRGWARQKEKLQNKKTEQEDKKKRERKWRHEGAGWLLRCTHQRNALFPHYRQGLPLCQQKITLG